MTTSRIRRHVQKQKEQTPGHCNPAGTKLVRRFIRQSGTEATYWRHCYRALTGRHYHEVAP